MKAAVLAVQGDFAEHENVFRKLGCDTLQIRQKRDLEQSFDALILPGGESTVQGKLLRELDMFDTIRTRILDGLPVMATCAGTILLAKQLLDDPTIHLGTLDIAVRRNAYGRQLGSFYTEASLGTIDKIPMTFIRAPYIEEVSDNVEILATVNSRIVAARQGNQLVTAFHPELNDDFTVHRYFIDICGGE